MNPNLSIFFQLLGTKVLTSQNVIVTLNSNIVFWRVIAFGIDFVIIFALFYGLVQLEDSFVVYDGPSETGLDFLFKLLYIPLATYSLLTEFLFDGRTLGKMICGIRVIKINGLKCGFSEYLLRWLFRMVDIYPFFFLSFFFNEVGLIIGFFLIGLPAFIEVITSPNHQRLGDLVAGTTVIKVVNKINLSKTIFKEIREDYVPTFSQVLKLSDNDMRIIKDTLQQARSNKNYHTIHKLRKKVEEVMQVQSNLPDIDFLNLVMDDFNHYTKNL